MLFKIIIGPLQLVLLIRGTEGFAALVDTADTADFVDRVDLAGIVDLSSSGSSIKLGINGPLGKGEDQDHD